MTLHYFKDCETLEAVKKLYRELAKQHHPDRGGDLATMQAINREYTIAIHLIATGQKATNKTYSTEEAEAEILNAEAYKNAINAIINLDGIEIEVCGGWIWVTGNTYPHRQIFKANGFYFASKKVAWYFRSVEYKTHNKKDMTLEQIRGKYGSEKVKTSRSWQQFLAK